MSSSYAVDAARCIRCGSCAILAPAVFAVTGRARLVRQPATAAERVGCAAAAIVCPTHAITTGPTVQRV